MVAKRSRWAKPDIGRLDTDLQSSDEDARARGVRGLCPCHAGWEVFEQHAGVVLRMLRDRSRVVRANALHVFEDASRMQSASDLSYQLAPGEERLGEKRAQRFRSMEERMEARRESRNRRRKRRRGRTPDDF